MLHKTLQWGPFKAYLPQRSHLVKVTQLSNIDRVLFRYFHVVYKTIRKGELLIAPGVWYLKTHQEPRSLICMST